MVRFTVQWGAHVISRETSLRSVRVVPRVFVTISSASGAMIRTTAGAGRRISLSMLGWPHGSA